MLFKCYHQLHPLSENVIVDQKVDGYCSFDIFEMTSSTNELAKKLVNKKILIFRRF
jgi:hypothetical protein